MPEQGELTKVIIIAFKDSAYKQKIQGDAGQIELPINPKELTRKLKMKYGSLQAIGAEGNDPDYKSTDPEKLTLTFTLDGTGVIPAKGNKFHTDVPKQLDSFLKVAYHMNSDTHRPNFLRLLWGNLSFGDGDSFDCVLQELDIKYTLFSPTGKPLRAELTAKFLSHVEQNKRIRKEGKKSPDVTHVRTVKADDTLPMMAAQIYGDQSYYLQVAKANGLINFRRLKTGNSLQFPPIDKTVL